MLLKLENVKTNYGNIRALKGISLEVEKGEIVCLIGANGAGKSTTLMTISGVLTPEEGDIERVFNYFYCRQSFIHKGYSSHPVAYIKPV